MNLDSILAQRAKVKEFHRKHRIGLLTLLFTDLVGSTLLKQQLGDRQAVAHSRFSMTTYGSSAKQSSSPEELAELRDEGR